VRSLSDLNALSEGSVSKTYVIAPRHGRETETPVDWQQRLSAIPGVTVHQTSAKYAQFSSEPETLERVLAQFGTDFIIEEVSQRRPL